jgi:hypothetical protein
VTALARTAALARPADGAAPCCTHYHPPLTPSGFYRDRRHILVLLGAVFTFLAVAAMLGCSWSSASPRRRPT